MKDYASRQRSPRKHFVGLGAVVVLHALLFWAINSGLAHKFVKIVKAPVEAVLLEETKPDIPPPPPPPPPKNLPPPPPAYVPPVEVQVNTPPPMAGRLITGATGSKTTASNCFKVIFCLQNTAPLRNFRPAST